MSAMRKTAMSTAVLAAMAAGTSQVWALAGGGMAPGGPMSGSMRPACIGYNMDGTVNLSPGADRPGCIDTSARAIHRQGAVPRSSY